MTPGIKAQIEYQVSRLSREDESLRVGGAFNCVVECWKEEGRKSQGVE